MTVDSKSLDRTAQRLIVEVKRAYGSPPEYDNTWQPLWDAKVDRITINGGGRSSTATVWFPRLRWERSYDVKWADMLRIRTNEPNPSGRIIVFSGFVVNYLTDFSGGTESGPGHERNAVVVADYRWLLSTTSPIFGWFARGPDDYTDYGTPGQAPIADSYTFFSGRRAIFNENGKPNRGRVMLSLTDYGCEVPVFVDPAYGVYWTARDMLRYVLSPIINKAYNYLPIADPNLLSGLGHGDWGKVLSHIVVEGLNVLEAVELICKHLGWSFREDYGNDGSINFVFYKIGSAAGYSRNNSLTILHQLHAPAVNENIKAAVSAGRKMLWSMTLAEDIAALVNNPWGLGAPHQFEFTAELVPAWLDDDLEPDTENGNLNLFFTDAELQEMTDPDSKSYYKYYHPRGTEFRRNVGRKWALNEFGSYSANDYGRGAPFKLEDVIDSSYLLNKNGKRLYGPFSRRLLPCLTVDKEDLNSVGTKVEFSFDGGDSWQVIPCSISLLQDECGIYIEEANLAELVDKNEGSIEEEGEEKKLHGLPLNFWTSLCGDKLWERPFKNEDGECEWKTRVRVTASIQLDQRLRRQSVSSPASGSPFRHSQIYDFSRKYGLRKRCDSSVFATSDLPARETDDSETAWFETHLDSIRRANEDMSISGQFTMERLWLGDGSGVPDFALGDCIENITGRGYGLGISFGGGRIYPEIIQIIYLPDVQKMKLITRDLRFAEVTM